MPSDFWARKIAPQPVPQPPAPAQQQAPWWQTGAPARQAQPVAPVVTQQPQPVQYAGVTPPAGEVPIGVLLGQSDYQTTKAKSSLDADLGACPDCGGPNYMGIDKQPNKMPRCYDCGYNPRFGQTMSGMSATGQANIPVKTARQQHGTTSDFNPQHIIGHV